MESVAANWMQLGLVLGFNYSVLKAIEKDNIFNHEDCCFEVLHKWLYGEACQPITWERLIEALRDLELNGMASSLEQLLSHTSQHPPSSSVGKWHFCNTGS